MMNDGIDLGADASATDEELRLISRLAQLQLNAEAEVAKLEDMIKQAKAKLKNIQETQLPEAMHAAGIEEFSTKNGIKVAIESDLSVSVPKAQRPKVASYLKEHNKGDLVTASYIVKLGKGDNRGPAVIEALKPLGVEVEESEDFHTGSLKSYLRKKVEDGEEVDFKFFGAYPWQKAKVTVKT